MVNSREAKHKTFGTFAGVFSPTTLTILGVILFIRQPWVVGNAGIVGALLIISLAVTITFTTGLSLSSITTNIRIGSGGAFSLIAHSMGLAILDSYNQMFSIINTSKISAIFCSDSGFESALV